ncbi:hypothetical protein Moror_9405 [Moniliophthora roreri MCA 2997]|uniref:DUF6535 domain-containing protein n=1 Tax=Moniliophthora roreri (strain MCA 2997) TaxID=1381753 RepID=V2WWR8_MONRO|nr:hypothetical protein Moror_9405 [Moniliophthora roreri MCA 2997]
MPSPDLTDNVDPERERRNAEFVFMREVARRNPYIPSVCPPSSQSTGKAGEELTPTLTESWEKVLKEVARYDEDIAKGWQDDIDTLLVFGGLFSAVVTAFVIESYQWLEEDPADTTVTLLNKLILVCIFYPHQRLLVPQPHLQSHIRAFRPAMQAVDTGTLRRDSFKKWGVPSVVSALPILLEVALLFFFVGMLDLLWNRHLVPFVASLVAVSFSAGLYFLTTLLPTLTVPRDQGIDGVPALQLTPTLLGSLQVTGAGLVFLRPPVYELRAFEWAVKMFSDSPSMIPHLENILGTIPPSVAASAVLGRWDLTMWKTVSKQDVDYALRNPDPKPQLNPTIPQPVLHHSAGINLLFHHQYWAGSAAHTPDKLPDELSHAMEHKDLQHFTGLHFVIPFPLAGALWTHQDPTVRAKGHNLLSIFQESWEPRAGHDEQRHLDERWAFLEALTDHAERTKSVSGWLAFVHLTVQGPDVQVSQVKRMAERIQEMKKRMQRVRMESQELDNLLTDYLARVPKRHPDNPAQALEIQRDLQVDNGVLDIRVNLSTRDIDGTGRPTDNREDRTADYDVDATNADDPQKGKRTDVGLPGDSIGQGDEVEDIGGHNYGLCA